MTKDERKILRELAAKSTRVNAWYPHGPENGDQATVRGPFCRWFYVGDVSPEDRKHVADMRDDANFAAAAMNNLVSLLDEIDRLEAQVQEYESEKRMAEIDILDAIERGDPET